MKTILENGAASVRNSQTFQPRCLDMTIHTVSRPTVVKASVGLPEDDIQQEYVRLAIEAKELPFEVPETEANEYFKSAVELSVFMSRTQAEEVVKALQEALAK